jgi:hypothetical protein
LAAEDVVAFDEDSAGAAGAAGADGAAGAAGVAHALRRMLVMAMPANARRVNFKVDMCLVYASYFKKEAAVVNAHDELLFICVRLLRLNGTTD